jgi:hypothetical protein
VAAKWIDLEKKSALKLALSYKSQRAMTKFVLLIVIAWSFSIYSCDECLDRGFMDCTTSFSFRVISQATREDLVFGPNPIYAWDSVYLFATAYSGRLSSVDSNKFTSRLTIPVDTFFLHFSQSEIDTLLLSYVYRKAPCCRYPAGYGSLTQIKIKGKALSTENGIFLIEK